MNIIVKNIKRTDTISKLALYNNTIFFCVSRCPNTTFKNFIAT
jgi:hypothetical protein